MEPTWGNLKATKLAHLLMAQQPQQSVMDNYQPTQPLSGLLDYSDPAVKAGPDAIGPPTIAGGLLSLDPTDYVGPQTLGKLAAGLKGLLAGGMVMGGIKSVGKAAPYAAAHETARKNAVKMLGLPENNTAMDRAKAMGAEFGWAHGSDNPNITTLKSSKIGAEGPGAYATNYLPESNTYAQSAEGATVYPLAVFKDKTLNSGTANPYELLGAADDVELAAKLKQMGKDSIIRTQQATPQWLIDAGGLPMPAREHYVSTNPSNFRSRFAAFDPARRHEADLLGRATPEMLGATTLGGLLGLETMRRNQE